MKKLTALALSMVLALSFVACGKPASSAPAAAGSGSATEATSTVSTPTLDAIKAKGKLVVMTATGFPPFEYMGADGKPAGVDVEIGQAVADALGVKLEVIDMDFNLLVESLKSGKGDLIAAGMTATDERKEQIDFTESYAESGQMIMLPADSTIKSVADLKDKKVAVQESTTGHIYVQDELGITPIAFKNATECATALVGGMADASVLDNVAAISLVKAQGDKLKTLPELATSEKLSIGIAKGQDDLVAFVNEVLAKAIKDGKIEAWMISHNEIASQG